VPELPEVQTTCNGIAPIITGKTVTDVVVRKRQLRWPVTAGIKNKLIGHQVIKVWRRGKYILLQFDKGSLIVHLGMSGHLAVVDQKQEVKKHDHVDIFFGPTTVLRYHDPRRFGAVLWTAANPLEHALLHNIGPEPLGPEFTADYLFTVTRKRKRIIRDVLLDGKIVAGIGNIYANEALFRAGIDPRRAAGRISRVRMQKLVTALVEVLSAGIRAGGTTLRDFRGGDGRPGYFQQSLSVYGRSGEPCPVCQQIIDSEIRGGRSLFYCRRCQI